MIMKEFKDNNKLFNKEILPEWLKGKDLNDYFITKSFRLATTLGYMADKKYTKVTDNGTPFFIFEKDEILWDMLDLILKHRIHN